MRRAAAAAAAAGRGGAGLSDGVLFDELLDGHVHVGHPKGHLPLIVIIENIPTLF